MDLEQKAGQLFVSWILARERGNEANRQQLIQNIREVGLGGVILSLGPVEDAAELVTELQRAASVPLLCAGDFEGGVAFRFSGATEMGNQMLVGATRSEELARAMGEVTGREARVLGVPWVFAPVLDVNSNPANPIINVRSFGEDPDLVARLGSAFAAGVRSQGAMPCGKHFPGHGDVNSDSHLELPTVPGDATRLREVELRPFQVASGQGLESVMTGHLAVPGLGEDPAVPATLSRKILGGVLRQELGFQGLVVTDALDMGGVKNKLDPGEVAVRALLAGADVLLMPPDPLAARNAVVAAVRAGRVPTERLDEAVLRLLRSKERLGLLDGKAVGPDPEWRRIVDSATSRQVGREIARRGVTLVQDARHLLPMEPRADGCLIEVHDRREVTRAEGALRQALIERGLLTSASLHVVLDPSSGEEEVQAAIEKVRQERRVVLSLHVRVRSYSGTIGLPTNVQPLMAALQPDQRLVTVSFGNPYLIAAVPESIRSDAAYLCAYATNAHTVDAVADVLQGSLEPMGELPVSLPTGSTAKAVDAGSGASTAATTRAVRDLLEGAVGQGVFPGAVCLASVRGKPWIEVGVGRESYEQAAPEVTPSTRYDLASLTKVCATTMVTLRLVAAGKLELDQPVQRWLPEFTGDGKEAITVRHLLAHSGGLPPYRRYFADATLDGREEILQSVIAEPLTYRPGTKSVYSDIGMILLMLVNERVGGASLEELAERLVFTPLGMSTACFAPTSEPALAAAPTERFAGQDRALRGHVHDENARALGGVSGHAGLFATAADVQRVGWVMLDRGADFLPAALVGAVLTPQSEVGSPRGLGFDLLRSGGWAGSDVASGVFGHTGFTGTSLWCEPERGICVVLLTNRVHPSREHPERIRDVRRRLHDLLAGSLQDA
jgi:beta-N-acetylhexosaminidase